MKNNREKMTEKIHAIKLSTISKPIVICYLSCQKRKPESAETVDQTEIQFFIIWEVNSFRVKFVGKYDKTIF